ncbi:MAG: hypothetical protein LBG04_01670 [Holosporaceae bacterium]|nr:hypothetical protein [Holosporaceae bacterium]
MVDNIFVKGVCLGYPEKVDKDSIKYTIYGICFLHMQDDRSRPFCCQYDTLEGKGRTFDIEDLTKERALFLYNKINEIDNIFVKTKIADVLWCSKLLGKDNIHAAELAVDGYYAIIDELLKKDLLWASKYLARVFNLASSMKNSEAHRELLSKIVKYADMEYSPNEEANECYFYLDYINKM